MKRKDALEDLTAVETVNGEGPIAWARARTETMRRLLFMAIGSRLLLILTAWIANYYQKNPTYQRYIDQGFQFTPRWLIDMWCRWDSVWYLSIAGGGYDPGAALGEAYSNMAFFPLYPYLVKLFAFWIPESMQSSALLLTAGLVLSNVCFFLSLVLLYYLAMRLLGDEKIAERTALLLVSLPAAFIFSAFYSESLYLFLSLCVCVAAERDRWFLSALFAALATLTRANGFIIALVPAWIYIARRGWDLRKIGWRWLGFLLVPTALAGHFFTLYLKSGNFFAFFEAQKAWARGTIGPLQIVIEFFDISGGAVSQVGILDRIFFVVFLFLSFRLLLRCEKLRAYGMYALILMILYGASGLMYSMTRYTAVVFPILIYVAAAVKDEEKFRLICLTSALIQVMLWIGWTNYYWIC